jgi:hypothetical protein
MTRFEFEQMNRKYRCDGVPEDTEQVLDDVGLLLREADKYQVLKLTLFSLDVTDKNGSDVLSALKSVVTRLDSGTVSIGNSESKLIDVRDLDLF